MSCPSSSRRGLLAAAGALGAGFGLRPAAAAAAALPATEPFRGAHQGGIFTPTQTHTYFSTFDLATDRLSDVAALMRTWTVAAERMARGETAAEDSGEALGLGPARLTITFGFGAGLFTRDGRDRYGLARLRPEALVDMPAFNGDQLVEARTGGDLSVQACADDPQVAFHAVRQLARLAYGTARMRWAQTGFASTPAAAGTPRNLMGFKDGTQRPARADLPGVVLVGDEGPAWMRGGSYVVVRRIRVALEHWDRTDVAFQEQVVGRRKTSGAPLGGADEFDAPDLASVDADGAPLIAEDAHVRLATAASNGGAQILRRGYAYNDGLGFTAERWPPWRQGMLYDAGLLFVAYQRDPRTGFIRIFETMAKFDALNQFTTHVGGGLFACPGGVGADGFVGERLFGRA